MGKCCFSITRIWDKKFAHSGKNPFLGLENLLKHVIGQVYGTFPGGKYDLYQAVTILETRAYGTRIVVLRD